MAIDRYVLGWSGVLLANLLVGPVPLFLGIGAAVAASMYWSHASKILFAAILVGQCILAYLAWSTAYALVVKGWK